VEPDSENLDTFDCYKFVLAMKCKEIIKKLGVVKIVGAALIVLLFILFVFREEIKESKYTKAKLEIFERMSDNKIKDWPTEISNVYDSLILEKLDTLNREN